MKVNIIAVTMPFEDTGMKDPVDLISYCARVSNPNNQSNFDTGDKLLKYCADHKHWSIFEMVNVVFEVETTRDIARQILRHDMHFQEFSLRYAEVDDANFVFREARMQDKKNRQNSIITDDAALQMEWHNMQQDVLDTALKTYKWALENGIAKEVARTVLPEGMTPSRIYINGTLRNFIHFCQVRTGNDTQLEHREISIEMWKILCAKFKFLKNILEETNASN